ncbi:hypothetical protein D3C85_1012660 [compost metagenome]
MPSMTPMMSTIFFDEALIEPIVSTTCDTTAPPFTATSEAETASWFACSALSAFCFTVEVSSSIDAAVCSSELACCSVREDRSSLPEAIWLDADITPATFAPTSATMAKRLALIWFNARSSPAISSPGRTVKRTRSPPAMVRATSIASSSGRNTVRPRNAPRPSHASAAPRLPAATAVGSQLCAPDAAARRDASIQPIAPRPADSAAAATVTPNTRRRTGIRRSRANGLAQPLRTTSPCSSSRPLASPSRMRR